MKKGRGRFRQRKGRVSGKFKGERVKEMGRFKGELRGGG